MKREDGYLLSRVRASRTIEKRAYYVTTDGYVEIVEWTDYGDEGGWRSMRLVDLSPVTAENLRAFLSGLPDELAAARGRDAPSIETTSGAAGVSLDVTLTTKPKGKGRK